jgi:hypothetical protein
MLLVGGVFGCSSNSIFSGVADLLQVLRVDSKISSVLSVVRVLSS